MSTDHQKYSMANQSDLIQAYAIENGMRIVRTYADPGRSGLTIRERPGLSRLLADVVGGGVDFGAILVYDISRWGRFQDADESAHYEFLCKRAGIRVVYCAEHFPSDETPFTGVLKSLKRAMAGEFSRELGVKIAAGKARVGGLGFRIGGNAGYGLNRQLLGDGVTPGLVLKDHQRKSIQTDRVTLIPGSEEEVQIVRRIYHECVNLGKSDGQIRDGLNSESITCFGRPWTRNLIRNILTNEKYIGHNVVGRTSQRLCGPTIFNPREKWIRHEDAFEAIVSPAMFDKVALVRLANAKPYIPQDAILKAMRVVLKREKTLTAAVIDRAPELPSSQTVCVRFGSLSAAYAKVGYKLKPQHAFHNTNRALRQVRQHVEESLLRELASFGIECHPIVGGSIAVSGLDTVAIVACRFQTSRPRRLGWRIFFERNVGSSTLVAIRMNSRNDAIQDFLVMPRTAAGELPLFIRRERDDLISSYRHFTVEAAGGALYALCSE